MCVNWFVLEKCILFCLLFVGRRSLLFVGYSLFVVYCLLVAVCRCCCFLFVVVYYLLCMGLLCLRFCALCVVCCSLCVVVC